MRTRTPPQLHSGISLTRVCLAAPATDDVDGDDMFYDEEEVLAGATEAQRAAALERLDAMLINDPQRFADDDEEDEKYDEQEDNGTIRQ